MEEELLVGQFERVGNLIKRISKFQREEIICMIPQQFGFTSLF